MATKTMAADGATTAAMEEITPEVGVTTLEEAAADGAKTTAEMTMVVWAAWVDLTHGAHKEEAEITRAGAKILAGSTTQREVVMVEITPAGVTTLAAADGVTTPAETEMEVGTMVATAKEAAAAMVETKGVDPCVATITTWYVLKEFLISLPPNCANQVRIVAA